MGDPFSPPSPAERKTTIGDLSNFCEPAQYFPQKKRIVDIKKKALPDITKNLNMILEMVNNHQDVTFQITTKSSRGLHNGLSRRRSRYVGVLGNGKNWQVLININKRKRYIGTYKSEKMAAVVHDFYSIGINGLKARTNFSYKKDTIREMINSFYENKKVFDPSTFISEV